MTADPTKAERPSGEGENRREDRQADAEQEQQRTEEGTGLRTSGKTDHPGTTNTESNGNQRQRNVCCRAVRYLVAVYRSMSTYEQISVPVSIVTLIAIIAAGVIYYCQLTAMQGATTAATRSADAVATQIAISQAQFENRERPMVEVRNLTGGEIVSQLVLDSDYQRRLKTFRKFTFVAENVGHGIAMRAWPEMFWVSAPLVGPATGFPTSSEHRIGASLEGASQIMTPHNPVNGTAEMSVDQLKAALSQSGIIWIYGWVQQCDSLGTRRYDPFCWAFTKDMRNSPGEHFLPCGFVPDTTQKRPIRDEACR